MKKIVLIEDDFNIRETTVDILKLSGYQIDTADNGKDGVKLVKEIQPDLVLCDIKMPEYNGYEVLRILSRLPETATIPFIFLSSNNLKEDIRKGMNLGADDYLTKPFKEMDLLDAIECRLKRSKAFHDIKQVDIKGLSDFMDLANQITPLNELRNKRIVKKYAKNEIVFKEEDYVKNVYFVISGKVKRIETDSHGKEFLDDIHYANQFFGYLSLFNSENSKHRRTAIAIEDTEVALIPKEDFKTLIFKNREIAANFIKMISGNVMDKEKRLLQLAYASVRERVANLILKLHEEELQNKNNTGVIKISRDDLANIIGTSKESLIRTLTEFKKDNVIVTGRAEIKIIDKNRMERIANGF